MKTYIIHFYNSSVTAEIRAIDPEKAMEKAMEIYDNVQHVEEKNES